MLVNYRGPVTAWASSREARVTPRVLKTTHTLSRGKSERPTRPDIATTEKKRKDRMSFAMQSFLCVRDALAKAERGVPDEVTQALQSRSFPPIAEATEVVPPSSAPCDGQTFVLRFASAPAAHLAPVGPGGDPTHAVLQIIGPEIGASHLFSPTAPASAASRRPRSSSPRERS